MSTLNTQDGARLTVTPDPIGALIGVKDGDKLVVAWLTLAEAEWLRNKLTEIIERGLSGKAEPPS